MRKERRFQEHAITCDADFAGEDDAFKSSHGYIRVYRIDIVGIACHRAAMSQDSRQ